MKSIYQNSMRRAMAVLVTGLALGGMFGVTARADMYRWPDSVPVENTNAGAIRGVQAAAIVGLPVPAGTNVTLPWYGMQGVYAVEGTANVLDPSSWTQLGAPVVASGHAWSATVPSGTNTSFRLRQSNNYSGSGSCSSCHGATYDKYYGTAHASALSTLQNIGMGSNPSCIPCHTVGYGQQSGYTDSTATPHLANVGCESCHGPAGWHKDYDHNNIHPAVSIDPAICGNCHQDSHHPTYEEYSETKHATQNGDIRYGNAAYTNYFTNTVIIGSKVYYGYAVTNFAVDGGLTGKTNKVNYTGWTNVVVTAPGTTNIIGVTNATSGIVNSSYVPGSGVDPGQSRAVQCGVCHSAATRYAMLSEYNDYLAGRGHNLEPAAPADAGAWTATCATCHDPHSTNYIAQLRYPTRSTNFYSMPTTVDTSVGTLRSTNALGQFATNTVYRNTTFRSKYDPTIQVCAQCHNSRGATWDGTAYGLVTNTVISTATNVDLSSDHTYYVTNVVSKTNIVAGVSNYFPVVTYVDPVTKLVNVATNADGSVCTNASGYGRVIHHSLQYNILIGQADKNYTVAPSVQIHSHGGSGNPNQCATCHAPSYAVSATTNVTGHTFELAINKDPVCMGCHPGLTDAAFEAKIEDLQYQETNNITRVVGLLNQWATTLAPAILRTNYGALAWEYTTPGVLGNPSGIATLVGPPAAFVWKTNQMLPVLTNDNLQMLIPASIRKARFNLYSVLHDGSLGVHNPTYTKTLLTNAEALVMGEFTSASYAASFSVLPVSYATIYTTYVGTNVSFTNLIATAGGTWSFGDGYVSNSTTRSVTYAYTNAGLYTVSYTDTASGSTMTRAAYIKVRAVPAVSLVADVTSGLAPLTVNFTNTSSLTSSVDWWRWQFNLADSSTRSETADAVTPVSYTYTTPGTYSVLLRANLAGGGNLGKTNVSYIAVAGLNYANGATTNLAPLTVTFTNRSVGMSNYVWTFGDGKTSTSSTNTANTYTNAGTYTVTLSGDYNGVTYNLSRTNVVAQPGPVASFYVAPAGGKSPLAVTFINTSSNATSYAWSFGDGNTSTNVYPVNVYTNLGASVLKYNVTLKAINRGVTNSVTITNCVTVSP
ncbi:MAG: PKD domain-containing protein [Verrucomicrobiota bacterium]